MTIYAGTEKIEPNDIPARKDAGIVCFVEEGERDKALSLFSLNQRVEVHAYDAMLTATRFESRHGHDYISLEVPNFENLFEDTQRFDIYFTGQVLVFAGTGLNVIQILQEQLDHWEGEAPQPARILYFFFSGLFYGDSAYLENMEDEIADIEELTLQNPPPKECVEQISTMRRRLMVLKRYYESTFDLLQDLEENQNGFFTKEQLRYFRIHTNRADRYTNTVVNLREYVSQVRESYQNQIDVNLNQTMKLFTVLTAIFFPLTLIAGWYGMNLQMPEYEMRYAYPVVIGISILVVVVCVLYFKKKKWF